MHVLPQQVTYRNILRVLMAGFALVILLLLVAGFIGTANIRSIQRNAATLVERQQDATGLIDEIQSEQEALSAVFYNLAREPELVDRAKILAELDAADQNISDIASQTEGTPEAGMGKQPEEGDRGLHHRGAAPPGVGPTRPRCCPATCSSATARSLRRWRNSWHRDAGSRKRRSR